MLSAFGLFSGVAQNPYFEPNNTWISLNGKVTEVTSADTFILNYGDGVIVVEMDDYDLDADAFKVAEGDRVQVNGWIDDDFFETTTIEARSVYVENLGTYFYASGADEEDAVPNISQPMRDSGMTIQGYVTKIDGRDFVVNTGKRQIVVDTSDMIYNPMDDEGFQQIEKGDRVSVSGSMDAELFEGHQLKAETIVTLRETVETGSES